MWQGKPLLKSGYGQIRWHGRKWQAHRLVYELSGRTIPDGLQIDHLCRVRLCVNPEHLEPVTVKENVLRGVGPSAINARKTACIRGHPLIPSPWNRNKRVCLVCMRAREARRKAVIK